MGRVAQFLGKESLKGKRKFVFMASPASGVVASIYFYGF